MPRRSRHGASQGPRIIGPRDGKTVDLGPVGVRFWSGARGRAAGSRWSSTRSGRDISPREHWHTFWNAGDDPCRIPESISPAGFEHFFDESAAGVGSPEEFGARYGTQVDPDRTRRLCEQHGLQFPING